MQREDIAAQFIKANDIQNFLSGEGNGELAKTLLRQGKYAEAEPLYAHCLKVSEKIRGPDQSWTLTSRALLAHAQSAQGKTLEAVENYHRSLQSVTNSRALIFSTLSAHGDALIESFTGCNS